MRTILDWLDLNRFYLHILKWKTKTVFINEVFFSSFFFFFFPPPSPQNYPARLMPANSPNTSSSQSSNHSQSGEQLSKTNLYIRGLAKNTTDKDLLTLCEM